MSAEKQLWDQQEEETHKAYSAFSVYRNFGPTRSLEKAARIYYNDEQIIRSSAKVRQFSKWSSNNNWVARVEAWDEERDKNWQSDQREAIRAMNKRQANYGMAMQGKGIARLLDMAPDELTPDQAARLTKTGVEIERPARGEAVAITEHKGRIEVDTPQLDPEIAKEVGDLIAKRKSEKKMEESTLI